MRADRFLRGWRLGALALVLSVAFVGCDDGGGDTPVPDGAGGTGGTDGDVADVGDTGGTGGDAMVDMAPACECPRGVCDPAGNCVDADPCEQDTECLDGNICEAGACVPGCADDAACAMADPATPICIDGRCGNCREDADCFGAGTCDPATSTCTEPDACTDSRECAGDRVCLDGACADRPDCNGGETCGGGWICLDNGECAPNRTGACAADDECGLGLVCLGSDPRACGACRVDDDCPGNQLCVGGAAGNRCQESGECGGDADCVAGRVCTGGVCAAPACADDGNEPDDGPMDATPIDAGLYAGLVSCNDDWFAFDLPADTTAEIVLRQRDRTADLALAIGGADGTEFARSQTPEPNEAVAVGPFPDARPLTVRVWQIGPASVAAYSLEIVLYTDGERCVDDRYDIGGGDDDRATARRVRNPGDIGFSGDLSGRLCPGDDDVFCFEVNRREEVGVSVAVLAGNPVIVGELFGPDEMPIANGTGRWSRGGEPDDILTAGGAGTWCLRLYTENEVPGTYQVSLSAVSAETRALCGAAEPLPLAGGAVSLDDSLEEDSIASPICASREADGGERVYTVTIDDPDVAGCAQNPCVYPPVLLTAQVEGVAGGTLGDPVVSVRAACEDNDSEVACADDSVDPRDPLFPRINPAVVRVPITDPGEYTLIVDGVDIGERPDYRLAVDARPLAAPPPNDTCGDAPLLDLLSGVAEVNANLGQARDDYAACLGAGGPDVAYAIRLDRTAYVRVQALAQPSDFAVGAYLVADCDSPVPVRCGFGFEGEVPPGDYFLVIDGTDPNARGQVTTQIVVEPYGDAPANETCETAELLDAAGGRLNGNTRPAGDDYRFDERGSCTGHNTIGGDVVYRLPRQAQGTYFIEAEPLDGWDLSLSVVNGCDGLANQRWACSDGALTESVVFEAPGSELYVIVDGSNGERGRFTLRWGPAECQIDIDCDGEQRCVDYACVDP